MERWEECTNRDFSNFRHKVVKLGTSTRGKKERSERRSSGRTACAVVTTVRGKGIIGKQNHHELQDRENSNSARGNNHKEEGEVSKRDKNVMQVDDEADDEGNNMNEAPESGGKMPAKRLRSDQNKNTGDQVKDGSMARREKREMSPTSPTGNNEVRLKKKLKSYQEFLFGGNTIDKTFDKGKLDGEILITKKKRRTQKRFGNHHEKCDISIEQIKEVGEMIGVSWTRAEKEKKQEGQAEGEGRRYQDGHGGKWEKSWIRAIIRSEKPDVIGLQETKSGLVDDVWIEDIWGSKGFGYAQLPANGNSGGILLIWDVMMFLCKEAIGDERFITVRGAWKGKDEDVFLVCIYGPHMTSQKASLWDRLTCLMNRLQGAWCIFGDLNVVRSVEDRFNSGVNLREANEFNDFINMMRLIEIPMGGRKFTRISDDGLKFSKLDRFLLNDEFNNLWGNLSVVALDRKLSDHYPIVLKDVDLDFGPKPFRVFNIWLEECDFSQVVDKAWKKDVITMRWELEAERRTLNERERRAWLEVRKQWEDREREYANMLRQKTRVKWDVEGDENTKFFHSFVKMRNNKCNIKGLMVNGIWTEDPKIIKSEMARYYKNLFSEGTKTRPVFCCNRIGKISVKDARSLEKPLASKY
ncbi:RNA-directed DNA polymerase, eukaryota [Tanacetum coccineum]